MSTPPPQIRVVLVDDQQLVRAGFRMVIDSQPDLTVVGEAGDGAAAVDLLRRTPADVVLMDIRMPGTDGIAATRQVTALPEPPRVVVLTTFDLDEYVVSAIGAGASGFLLKDAPPEEMLGAVRTVHAGEAVIAASSTRRLLQHVAPMLRDAPAGAVAPTDTRALAELTPRERDVHAVQRGDRRLARAVGLAQAGGADGRGVLRCRRLAGNGHDGDGHGDLQGR